jgi:hypothetical protein
MDNDVVTTQIAENFRFYGDMRFKQLSLFMAAMTAAAAGVVQYPPSRWWVALGKLYVAAVMWVVETRATLNAIAAHDAIPEVFPQRKKFWPLLNSSWAVLSLHIAFYALWLLCIRAWAPNCKSFYVGLVGGITLLVFSGRNYWRHRRFWLGPR